jgi:PAS domain-containing protein
MPGDFLETIDHALLTEAWHNASVAAVVFDENRTFVAMNNAYLDLVGYSRDEINAMKAGTNLLADEEGRLAYLELITRDERLQGSAPIRTKDDQSLMVDYVIVPTHCASIRSTWRCCGAQRTRRDNPTARGPHDRDAERVAAVGVGLLIGPEVGDRTPSTPAQQRHRARAADVKRRQSHYRATGERALASCLTPELGAVQAVR